MLTKILTHKDSVISRSGQTKKWTLNFGLVLFSGLLLFSGILTIVFETQLNHWLSGLISADIGLLLIGTGMLVCIYAIIRLSISIKCPHCRLRWYWYGMAKDYKRNINIGWMSHCPRCNYPEVSDD